MGSYVGYVFIFLAATFWGLVGPVARFALEAGLEPSELGFWRAALGGIFFLLHSAKNKGLKVQNANDLIVFALFGACCLGGFFASNQYAIQTGGAAMAAVMLYTAPAWVAVFSRFFFKERITLVKTAAIGISLAGVALISLSGGNPVTADGAAPGASTFSMAGLFFGLLSGFLYSTNYIFSKKYLNRYAAYTLYGYCMIFAAVSQLPFVSFTEKSPMDWVVLVTLGLVCTYGAYLAYCAGMKRLEPTKAAVLATFEPVVATVAAWWIWQETFAFTGWIGAALIIAAVLLLVLKPAQHTPGSPDDA